MSEVFSILLHNRQRYEQGKEGLWFSLPTTTEKLQETLREIGISADNPQDFFLYDYRSPQERPIKLPRDLVLSADVDELNFLAARLEKLDAAGQASAHIPHLSVSHRPVFLLNSCLSLFSAAWFPRHPLSLSYGAILPSSLTMLLPPALGFSPHPPVSVYGTGTV